MSLLDTTLNIKAGAFLNFFKPWVLIAMTWIGSNLYNDFKSEMTISVVDSPQMQKYLSEAMIPFRDDLNKAIMQSAIDVKAELTKGRYTQDEADDHNRMAAIERQANAAAAQANAEAVQENFRIFQKWQEKIQQQLDEIKRRLPKD